MTDEANKLKNVAKVVSIGLLAAADVVTLRTLATFVGETVIASNPTELIPLASGIAQTAKSGSTDGGDYEAASTYKSYCMQGTLCFVNPRGRLLYSALNIIDIVEGPKTNGQSVGPTGMFI